MSTTRKRAQTHAMCLALIAATQACSDTNTPSMPEPVEHTTQRFDLGEELTKDLPEPLKTVVDAAGSLAASYSGISSIIGMVSEILRFAHVLNSGDETSQKIDALSRQLDAVAGALSWQISAQFREDRLSEAGFAAINAAEIVEQTGAPLKPDSPPADQSGTALTKGEEPSAFLRLFNDAATNGDGIWKGVLDPSQMPQLEASGFVYDWRVGIPALMQLIALRVQVIAAIYPTFTRNRTLYSDELMAHRTVLLEHYRKMLDGVRCGTAHHSDFDPALGISNGIHFTLEYRYGCADIYSGLSGHGSIYRSDSLITPADDAIAAALRVEIYEAIRHQLPFFAMRKIIDALYHYANPGKDLAARFQRIPLSADPSLCVDVQGGSATPGTQALLSPCDGSAGQKWTYDRRTGRILNPELGQCLEVLGGSMHPGTPVGTAVCDDQADSQRWTYDPESGTLESAVGTVLSAGTPNLFDLHRTPVSQTLLVAARRIGETRQGWLADACTGAECECTTAGQNICDLEGAACERVAERDLCRWSAQTQAACGSTPGIWTPNDSDFASKNPGAVVPGTIGACITQANNLRQNVALGRSAFQWPDPGWAPASNAVDGNRDGNYSDGSVTHTDTTAGPWWWVDLGSVRRIREINLYNRTDCCSSRLSHYVIKVSSDSTDGWNGLWQVPVDASNTIISDGDGTPQLNPVDVWARWVAVTLNDTNFLSLAEVEVLGW